MNYNQSETGQGCAEYIVIVLCIIVIFVALFAVCGEGLEIYSAGIQWR